MRKKNVFGIFCLLTVFGCGTAETPQAINFYVPIDISKSSPIFNLEFRKQAAEETAKEVGKLPYTSKIFVTTFGSFEKTSPSWLFEIDARPAMQSSAKEVTGRVEGIILRIPQLVGAASDKTALLGYFQRQKFENPCRMVVLSDFIEDNEINVKKLFKNPNAKLPEMPNLLPDCDVRVLGFGHGLKEGEYMRLTQLFSDWFRTANPGGTLDLKS